MTHMLAGTLFMELQYEFTRKLIQIHGADKPLLQPLTLDDKPTNVNQVKNAPTTVVNMKSCRITGKHKPPSSLTMQISI